MSHRGLPRSTPRKQPSFGKGVRLKHDEGRMRHFDVDEANRLVPLLQKTFELVQPWVTRAQEVYRELQALAPDDGPSPATDALEAEKRELIEQIRQKLAPLEEMGLEIKAADGLVDFRALREGRTVYLC